MSDGSRLEYYYISEVGAIENKLQQLYTETYPNKEHDINIVKDKKWSYYKDFLYPNEETLAYMTDEKLVTQIHSSGDNTAKSRKINHWLHFKSERKMNKCKAILVKEGFTFESQTINRETKLPYELQVSNNGSIVMNSIHDTTRLLNEISRDFKGKYEGWETSFVK